MNFEYPGSDWACELSRTDDIFDTNAIDGMLAAYTCFCLNVGVREIAISRNQAGDKGLQPKPAGIQIRHSECRGTSICEISVIGLPGWHTADTFD